jgi:hypothetical protein
LEENKNREARKPICWKPQKDSETVSKHKQSDITRKEEDAHYGIHEEENLKHKRRRRWQPTKEVDSPNGFFPRKSTAQASKFISII